MVVWHLLVVSSWHKKEAIFVLQKRFLYYKSNFCITKEASELYATCDGMGEKLHSSVITLCLLKLTVHCFLL